MLENLDTISWSTLIHAYGSASDVPGQIRALTSNNKKKRDRALWELYGNIFHQGTRYEATPYAIPFLYELLDMSSIEEKEKIIYLLVNLALGYEEEYLPEGFDPKDFRCRMAKTELNLTPNERSECKKYGFSPPVVIDCYDAVLKGVQLLLKLLDNPDVKIRQAATYALAWFPEIANDSVRTIRNRLERETDDLSIANIILAIGLLARQSKHEINLAGFENYLSSQNTLIIKVAASIALANDPLKEDILDTLIEAIINPEKLKKMSEGLMFNEGNLAGYASLVLASSGKRACDRVIPALCETLKLVNVYQSLDVTQALLNLTVTDPTTPVKEKPVASLTPLQKKAFTAIAEHGGWKCNDATFVNYCQLVQAYGLPDSQEALVQYLS